MKKLIILVFVVILNLFILSGCDGVVPSDGENENEQWPGNQEITVEIDESALINNKTYIKAGVHDITVTFPEPVAGWVKGNITSCSGDYSKKILADNTENEVVFFPNEDRTVWVGSGVFGGLVRSDMPSPCCASYLQITSGQCEDEICLNFPFILDRDYPYAAIELSLEDCTCGGYKIFITENNNLPICQPDMATCGDDCSGLASWSISFYYEDIFTEYQFECNQINPCIEPIFVCSGNSCPIECSSGCLTKDFHCILIELADNAGNTTTYSACVYDDNYDMFSIWDGREFDINCYTQW